MEEKIKGILIDVEKGSFKVVEIEDTLKEYYRILNCDCIDIVTRYIGSSASYKIILDDCGAIKFDSIPSAIDIDGNIHFYGNLFIVSYTTISHKNIGYDDEIVLRSLDNDDIEYLQNFIYDAILKSNGRKIKVLTVIC